MMINGVELIESTAARKLHRGRAIQERFQLQAKPPPHHENLHHGFAAPDSAPNRFSGKEKPAPKSKSKIAMSKKSLNISDEAK